MGLVAAVCPQCGASLKLQSELEFVKCEHCGVDVIVRDAIDIFVHQGNPNNLKLLAEAATDAGNYPQAYALYSRLLEITPKDPVAWIALGNAAGHQSSFVELRLDEARARYLVGIECAPEANRPALRRICAVSGVAVALSAWASCRGHYFQFLTLTNAISDYLGQCEEIIEFIKFLNGLHPGVDGAEKLIGDICESCLRISLITSDERAYFKSQKNSVGAGKKNHSDSRNRTAEEIASAAHSARKEREKAIERSKAANKAAGTVLMYFCAAALLLFGVVKYYGFEAVKGMLGLSGMPLPF